MTIGDVFKIPNRLNSIRRFIFRRPKPLILMYHRISDEPINHWGLSVSPENFQEHLTVLRRTRYPLPLITFVKNLITGTLQPNAIALTFDDGYVDNLAAAKPLLAAADVPATVFVTTGYLNRTEPIWSDELSRLLLLERGPPSFEIVVYGERLNFDFSTEPPARNDGTTPLDLIKKRVAALTRLREVLMILHEDDRKPVMDRIRLIFAESDYHASLGRAMTNDEVCKIVADGLVTLGAHTVTHPVLPKLKTAERYREIFESKLACEALIKMPVAAFAYPYGQFDSETRDMVKMAGFTCACSVQRGPAIGTSDIFSLPRVNVSNVDGDAFEHALISASQLH